MQEISQALEGKGKMVHASHGLKLWKQSRDVGDCHTVVFLVVSQEGNLLVLIHDFGF